MILPNAKRVIFLNAGHSLSEPGAVRDGILESGETKKIRDACLPLLQAAGFEVHSVPDDLRLAASIAWVNQRAIALNDGLAIDIHLNAFNDPRVRGAEVFHGTSGTMRKAAVIMSKEIAKSMGIPDRGAKPDTAAFVGSLGWIRKTNCWALLPEVCFISSPADMAILTGPGGYEKAAEGIVNGCKKIFGIDETLKKTLLVQIVGLLKRLVVLLQKKHGY